MITLRPARRPLDADPEGCDNSTARTRNKIHTQKPAPSTIKARAGFLLSASIIAWGGSKSPCSSRNDFGFGRKNTRAPVRMLQDRRARVGREEREWYSDKRASGA